MFARLTPTEKRVLAERFGVGPDVEGDELLAAARAKVRARVAKESPVPRPERKPGIDGLTPEERLLRAIFGEDESKKD